ncbi:MAG: IS481 family transposase [Hyphomicrobium sp.]|jgi:transposase InsO family protein
MNTHDNARLTPRGREQMVRAVVDDGLSKVAAARRFNTSTRTVAKWVGRFLADGADGLLDRSSRPHSSPSQIDIATCEAVEALRRQRTIQAAIAKELGLSPATVSRILKRRGLSLLSSLEPAEPRPRYERETPGEIIHIDIKKLGRFNRVGHRITGDRTAQQRYRKSTAPPGWEYVHVAIDDHSRIAFTEIKPSERQDAAVEHLRAAVAYYRKLGVNVIRVMTDNGGCYRSRLWRKTCQDLGIKHLRTKPYTPQTNGKAERFIQTAIREWAYATAFEDSEQRKRELPRWLHRYNWHRPHASLGGQPPISRIRLTGNNLLRHHN